MQIANASAFLELVEYVFWLGIGRFHGTIIIKCVKFIPNFWSTEVIFYLDKYSPINDIYVEIII